MPRFVVSGEEHQTAEFIVDAIDPETAVVTATGKALELFAKTPLLFVNWVKAAKVEILPQATEIAEGYEVKLPDNLDP